MYFFFISDFTSIMYYTVNMRLTQALCLRYVYQEEIIIRKQLYNDRDGPSDD